MFNFQLHNIKSFFQKLWRRANNCRLILPPVEMSRKKPLIVILGCTGTGKSDLGIAVAKNFNGEVISADSMQIYKGWGYIQIPEIRKHYLPKTVVCVAVCE